MKRIAKLQILGIKHMDINITVHRINCLYLNKTALEIKSSGHKSPEVQVLIRVLKMLTFWLLT